MPLGFRPIVAPVAVLASAVAVGGASAEEEVQSGSLSGEVGEPTVQIVEIQPFDDMGGTRRLEEVRLRFTTFVSGGYETTGSGRMISILLDLSADWSRNANPLAQTRATVDLDVIDSSPPIAVSVFDNDVTTVSFTDPAELATWQGDGPIELSALAQFQFEESPAGIINFGGGGGAQYTVTYVWFPADLCPADLDGSGEVAFGDVLQLLSAWGPCDGCAADLDGSGAVDFADLLATLSAWGPCSGPGEG